MCSVFKSPHLLRNVAHYSTKGHSSRITIISNGGSMECSQVGKLRGLSFPVWDHPDSIANIVSLAEMVRKRHITMDSDVENALLLHAHDGRILLFVACGGGLYTHDLTNKDHCVKPILTLTQTVAHIESKFTKRKVKQAQAARDLQHRFGYPSQRTLEHLLESNYYPNCPVTLADVRHGITIYGPLPKLLQGKIKRVTQAPVPSTTIVNLPSYILKEHGTVTIAIDFFAVNDNYFLHTRSRKLYVCTTKPVANCAKSTMLLIIKQVIKLYSNRGFAVHELVGDNKFECISNDITPIQANIVACDTHVPDAETLPKL